MQDPESKNESGPIKWEDGLKQVAGVLGALQKMLLLPNTWSNSSSPTAKDSESQSENGKSSEPTHNDSGESQECASTLNGTASGSSSQKSGERTYGLALKVATYGSPDQVLQEAQTALRVLKLAGIEVSHYEISVNE